jgi:predicted HicB family RNase H-like nuclease
MPDETPYLNVYLGPLKKPWQAYCAARGEKPGAALKKAIEAQLSKSQSGQKPQAAPKQQKSESPDTGQKARLELRLTPTERAAITEFAQADECSPQQWIVGAIRAALTRSPQFGMVEWKILGESNYQLLAIGRNLNQIARHLNEEAKSLHSNPIDIPGIQREFAALRKYIKRHVANVDSAMRANTDRWKIV